MFRSSVNEPYQKSLPWLCSSLFRRSNFFLYKCRVRVISNLWLRSFPWKSSERCFEMTSPNIQEQSVEITETRPDDEVLRLSLRIGFHASLGPLQPPLRTSTTNAQMRCLTLKPNPHRRQSGRRAASHMRAHNATSLHILSWGFWGCLMACCRSTCSFGSS